jgi:hypothetical protein
LIILDGRLTLTWEYEEPCDPDSFQVELFSPDTAYPLRSLTAILPGSARSWDAGSLEPGRRYSWRVTVLDCGAPGPVSATATFFTGPYCSPEDGGSMMEPTLLRPFDGEVIRSSVSISPGTEASFIAPSTTLLWDHPNACLPGYSIQISRDPTFRRAGLDAGSVSGAGYSWPYSLWWFPWPEQGVRDCDRIFWRVLLGEVEGYDAPTVEERYAGVYAISETWSFVVNIGGLFCPPDRGSWITPIPYVTLPPDLFEEPPVPMITVIEDSACWSGPSMEYLIIDYLTPGQELEIQGRDQGGGWWYVDDPAIHKACWVFGEHVQTSGDLSQVPVQQAPPVPTRTQTIPPPSGANCGQYSNPNSCGGDPACQWVTDAQHPNGGCVEK